MARQDDILQEFLKQGKDQNVPDEKGQKPLQMAARNGHRVCVSFLLKITADINHSHHRHNSPLEIPSKNGHTDVLRILLERATAGKESALDLMVMFEHPCTAQH